MGQEHLIRTIPEEAGFTSESILNFVEQAKQKSLPLYSFMLLRGGKVAAEGHYGPFKADHLHPVFSVSKSFTSAAIGIAIGEGLLRLTDKVVDFFPDKVEGEPHPYIQEMTVEHLLLMATVHAKSTDTQVEDWVKSFLNTPPVKRPGSSFAYDTTGTHTLSAILQKVTGMSLIEYLQPRLFEPLSMGNVWADSCPLGIVKGGSGIRCTTEALAKFGQLYLQDGIWDGVRILPEGWVVRSTGNRIGTYGTRMMIDGKWGYGYKFWRIRHNGYCAYGMGGQLITVLPDWDVVFVTTANTLMHRDGQSGILDCFWATIYAALERGSTEQAERGSEVELASRLASLGLLKPDGLDDSPKAASIHGQSWLLDSNPDGYETCAFVLEGEGSRIVLSKAGTQSELRFGLGNWSPGKEVYLGTGASCHGAGVWTDECTLVVTVHLNDLLQMLTLTCRFHDDDGLSIEIIPAGEVERELQAYLTGRRHG